MSTPGAAGRGGRAAQGAFWEMHDLLLDHQDVLWPGHLVRYAGQLGLDVEQVRDDLRTNSGATRVTEDVDSADLSGVSGTPTFFINGRRHYGAYDIATLSAAVQAARRHAAVSPGAASVDAAQPLPALVASWARAGRASSQSPSTSTGRSIRSVVP